MSCDLLTAPTTTLISLGEYKEALGIQDALRDTALTTYIRACSDLIEEDADQCWRSQSFLQCENGFRCRIWLERSPIQSVSVSYYDSSNALQPFTDYTLKKTPLPCLIVNSGVTFPETYCRWDSVQITINCAGTIPSRAKALCFALVGEMDTNRELMSANNLAENPVYQRCLRSLRRGLVS
jgi:hypothetical protein